MAHDDQLLIHALRIAVDTDTLPVLCTPESEVVVFALAPSEEEDAALGIFLYQLEDNLFHQAWGIDLSLVRSERCDADPLLEALLGAYLLGQHIQIAAPFREDGVELADVNGIAQSLEHIYIIIKGCRQLLEMLSLL